MRKTLAILLFLSLFFISSTNPVQGSYNSEQIDKSTVSSGGSLFTELKGEMLSVDIKDEPLKKVLEQLSNKNGITFILPPSLGEENVMMRFSNLKLDEGLNKILGPYNRIFIYCDSHNNHNNNNPPESPIARLTEVRIFPHVYEGRVKEPLMRISEGLPQSAENTDKRTRKYEITRSEEEREEESVKVWSSTLKGSDSEMKLEAIKSLTRAGNVKAVEALTVAMKDRDPKVKREAVDALKKIGENIKDEGSEDVVQDNENEEEQTPEEEGKAGNATLSLGSSSGNSTNVELSNDVPVKGVQFTLNGAKPSEVRTTSRTEGFFAKVNESSGTVIMVSLSGKTIAPGEGPIAEVVCKNGGSAHLSGQTISK